MNRLAVFSLSVLAGWSVAWTVHAQSAVSIYSFDASGTNGANPVSSLTLGSDGNFYGTAQYGGIGNPSLNTGSGGGTVFQLTTNGTLKTLVNFNGTNGSNPRDALTLAPDGSFYGTTEYGGSTFGNTNFNASAGGGTVFRVTTNGTLTTLANFSYTNGATLQGGVVWGPDGNLYGTTSGGGLGADGTVFQVTTGGTLTTLTNFAGTNGASPVAGLTLGPDGNFYGTTESGGSANYGTVFQVTTSGTLTTLASFNGNNNGVSPQTGLALGTDGNLYGTTSQSYLLAYVIPGYGTINIPSGSGTIFRITTSGVLTTLADLDNYNAGTYPNGTLALGPDGKFYGDTYYGGDNGYGAIFQVTTNGTLTTLVSFNNTNGAYSVSGLTFGPDNTLYGTTSGGGSGANGVVFELLPPPFSITLAGSGGGNYTLSVGSYPDSTNRIWATTNLASSSWQVLGTVTADAVGVGQFLDTNTTNVPAKYYRLSYP